MILKGAKPVTKGNVKYKIYADCGGIRKIAAKGRKKKTKKS